MTSSAQGRTRFGYTVRQEPPVRVYQPLRIQPVLLYDYYGKSAPGPRGAPGGIVTVQHVAEEERRIRRELDGVRQGATFPLEILPLALVSRVEHAERLENRSFDGVLVYGAGGPLELLDAVAETGKYNILFVRHRTGPVYRWYKMAHAHFLRRRTDAFQQPAAMNPADVVVDNYEALVWRLQALYGLRNTEGARIVVLEGANAAPDADAVPGEAEDGAPYGPYAQWNMDVVPLTRHELHNRFAAALADRAFVARVRDAAAHYLATPDVMVFGPQTGFTAEELFSRRAVNTDTTYALADRAFLAAEIFRDILREANAAAITTGDCQTQALPVTNTTACLTNMLLNDDGFLAFCESDFAAVPAGFLLHHIAGAPVFLGSPAWPHNGMLTLCHCTAPRRMDGMTREPVKIRTFPQPFPAAAPKVEFRLGQEITLLGPDFDGASWQGLRGTISANPNLDLGATQTDILFDGDAQTLARSMRGLHWVACYGDYRREVGYALGKKGLSWRDISSGGASA